MDNLQEPGIIPLSKEELEATHSAATWGPWVREKIDEIGATDEGRTAVRLRKGFCKPLVEEALPMSIFASLHFDRNTEVHFHHKLGNQNFDASISYIGGSGQQSIRFLEVTQARLGEEEYLRSLELDQKGTVPMYGAISKSGTKNTSLEICFENEMVKRDDTVARTIGMIQDAIDRKAGKTYPEDTALIVVFDGQFIFADPDDVEKISHMLRSQFTGKLTQFCWLSVVCWTGEIKIDFSLAEQP